MSNGNSGTAAKTRTPAGTGPVAASTPKPRKPRTVKPKQPAWYKAVFSDGSKRFLEDFGPEAVMARCVTVTPASFEEAAEHLASGGKLESKNTATTSPDGPA